MNRRKKHNSGEQKTEVANKTVIHFQKQRYIQWSGEKKKWTGENPPSLPFDKIAKRWKYKQSGENTPPPPHPIKKAKAAETKFSEPQLYTTMQMVN